MSNTSNIADAESALSSSSDFILMSLPSISAVWVDDDVPKFRFANDSYPGDEQVSPPPGPFLYSKLASLTGANFTYGSYLYHQVNETAFAELMFDATARQWYRSIVHIAEISNPG